jgi:hypothetical protein
MDNLTKNSIRVKFLFILIFSNITLYYFLQTGIDSATPEKRSPTRKNYIPLKINAELRTILSSEYPVQLVTKDKGNTIKNVFILKKYTREPQSEQSFLIHIHKSAALKINVDQTYEIYPIDMEIITPRSRSHYEIQY